MSGTVGRHAVRPFPSPVNAVHAPVDANVVRSNDNTVAAKLTTHDADATIHVQSSTVAARPAFGVAGRVWVTTDGTPAIWLDTGAAWVAL